MQLLTIPLKANQTWPLNRGRFVRVFDALYPVTIKTQVNGTGSNQESKLIANMGAEFVPFERAELVSEKDQTVVLAYSELNIFDNRMGVESSTIMQTLSPQVARIISNYAVTDSARVKVLAANTKRKKALIATTAECVFYDSETGGAGFKINGDFDDSSNGELWALATTAASVEVMEFNYD